MRSGALLVGTLVMLTGSGCWEQIDGGKWFPQMKRQLAVQAFEEVLPPVHPQGFTPPEGTLPVTWAGVPDLRSMDMRSQDAVQNPVQPTLASLKRGEQLFLRYCATCHGPNGTGNGPVAGPPWGSGPFGMVLPIGGPTSLAKALTDGHIYTTISLGRGRMPNYARIEPQDRWNVVNYLREMNGGRP